MEIMYERDGQIRVISLDATIGEDNESTSTVTERKVATGAAVADNVRQNRDTLRAEVVVSDTPLSVPEGQAGAVRSLTLPLPAATRTRDGAQGGNGSVRRSALITVSQEASANVLQFDEPFLRALGVYNELLDIKIGAFELQVQTTQRAYERMILKGISNHRDSKTTKALIFNLDFVQVTFADSEIIDSPDPLETRAQRRRRRGSQAARPASMPADSSTRNNASLLCQIGGIFERFCNTGSSS